MAQQTQINGNRYSFTNITVTLAGIIIPRGVFKSINYDCTQDPGIVQGNQVTIVGRTSGYGTATGSFEMLDSEFDDFAFSISDQGQLPIMGFDFVIAVTYSVNDVIPAVRTDTLEGTRITSIKSSNSQGNEASYKSCDLSIARILLDGIVAYGDVVP